MGEEGKMICVMYEGYLFTMSSGQNVDSFLVKRSFYIFNTKVTSSVCLFQQNVEDFKFHSPVICIAAFFFEKSTTLNTIQFEI